MNSAAAAFLLILKFDLKKWSNWKALEKNKNRKELFSITRSIFSHQALINEVQFENSESNINFCEPLLTGFLCFWQPK